MKVSSLKQPLKGSKFLTETIRNNFSPFFSTAHLGFSSPLGGEGPASRSVGGRITDMPER